MMKSSINKGKNDNSCKLGFVQRYTIDGKTFIVRSIFRDEGEKIDDILLKLMKQDIENP